MVELNLFHQWATGWFAVEVTYVTRSMEIIVKVKLGHPVLNNLCMHCVMGDLINFCKYYQTISQFPHCIYSGLLYIFFLLIKIMQCTLIVSTLKHYFCWISILQFSYVENSLHFNLAEFPVDFIGQFVSLWWWAMLKIYIFLILRSWSNRQNLVLWIYTRLTVVAVFVLLVSIVRYCRLSAGRWNSRV